MGMEKWLRILFGGGSSPAAGNVKPVEAKDVELRLKNDFGAKICFAGYTRAEEGTDPRLSFGERISEFPKAFGNADVVLYQMRNGKKAVGLFLDIPTFDSGDRQSDSWHALYLAPGDIPGSVDGAYCTGGYILAYAVWCRNLQATPVGLKDLLKEHGIIPGKKDTKKRHKPGEKFCVILSGYGRKLWFDVDASGKSAALASYQEAAGDLEIPETADGLPVTGIGKTAFYCCSGLSRAVIPKSVRSIGRSAFSGCGGLRDVLLENGLQSIGADAFDGCGMLEKVTIPESVREIGSCAFKDCRNLKKVRLPGNLKKYGGEVFAGCTSLEAIEAAPGCSMCRTVNGVLFSPDGKELRQYPAGKKDEEYTVPKGTERIDTNAFSGNAYLRRVIFPEGVAGIGKFAFQKCSGLEEVRFPDSLTRLGDRSFEDCTSLKSVFIPANMEKLCLDAFTGCGLQNIKVSADNPYYMEQGGVLFDRDRRELVFFPRKGRMSCTVPGGIKRIGDYAFAECEDLREIILPESLEEIGKEAFKNCRSLQKIRFPESVKDIEEAAFQGCRSLRELKLPEGIGKFGKAAFLGCESLEKVVLPGSLKSISRYGFAGCKNLNGIDLPEGLTSICCYAFSGCSLTRMVLPKSIRYIEELAFEGCSIPHMIYRGNQDDWIEKVDLHDDAFCKSGGWGVEFLEGKGKKG